MEYFKGNPDIMFYILDLIPNKYPLHDFLYKVIGTLYMVDSKILIRNAIKKEE